MGNRNSVKVTYSTGDSIYLYSHWGGSELPGLVERVALTSSRLHDESYFTRVLFCAMLGDDLQDWRGETGFGIAPYVVDHDHDNRMVHVDYTRRTDSGAPLIYQGNE
jgi:hypothetical protein